MKVNLHMTNNEYLTQCLVTWNKSLRNQDKLLEIVSESTNPLMVHDYIKQELYYQQFDNIVHGLVGETIEFQVIDYNQPFNDFVANCIDEAGDILYYVYMWYNLHKLDVNKLSDVIPHPQGTAKQLKKLLSDSKKLLYHGKQVDIDELTKCVNDLYYNIVFEMDSMGVTLDEIKEFNIAKLRKRFGDSFKHYEARLDKQTYKYE